MIHVQELSKKFGDHWVLRNLNFTVQAGEAFIIQGKNGSGKSTLLRILAGLAKPTRGKVVLELPEVTTDLGYCGLEQSLFAQLSVLEHLVLAAEMRGVNSNHQDLIQRVGLTYHTHHKSGELSSGLKARLKIALAIQAEPKLLIWDEPGVAMDDTGRQLIANVIEEQKRRGALILATNDPTERRYGTHEIVLD